MEYKSFYKLLTGANRMDPRIIIVVEGRLSQYLRAGSANCPAIDYGVRLKARVPFGSGPRTAPVTPSKV
jgi:hypothetical protein